MRWDHKVDEMVNTSGEPEDADMSLPPSQDAAAAACHGADSGAAGVRANGETWSQAPSRPEPGPWQVIVARAGGLAINAVSAKRRGGRRLTRISPGPLLDTSVD